MLNLDCQLVTLLGGGGYTDDDLRLCLSHAPTLISADGGLQDLNTKIAIPKFAIGDLDSIRQSKKWESLGVKLIEIKEQETTDFEKCIKNVNAKAYICLGFTARRLDHFLAVCSCLVKYPDKKIILIGSHDVIVHIPDQIEVNLAAKTRVSLFPMKKVEGVASVGLKWPISGITFEPGRLVGTSNETVQESISIKVSGRGMLLLLPREGLAALISTTKN